MQGLRLDPDQKNKHEPLPPVIMVVGAGNEPTPTGLQQYWDYFNEILNQKRIGG